MKSFVPPNIWSTTQAEMQANGLSPAITCRIWKHKVIWFVRADPSLISKIHAADLEISYSIRGLDLIELRAIWASLPAIFQNDIDKRKETWREKIRTRLKEMTAQEKCGTLSTVLLRNVAYGTDKNAVGPFDPNSPCIEVVPTRGSAFKSNEPDGDLQNLCSTSGTVASRRSSLCGDQLSASEDPKATTNIDDSKKSKLSKRISYPQSQSVTPLMSELKAKFKGTPQTPPPNYKNVALKKKDDPGAPPSGGKTIDKVIVHKPDLAQLAPPSYHSLLARTNRFASTSSKQLPPRALLSELKKLHAVN